ncbi:MAG: hypothetical protein E7644_06780 [Ruminococcaceae bacterium]|nr:hypothetical protein [Oscillospiraceae bacterium]
MKKVMYVMLIWTILISLLLPCGASWPVVYEDYEKYEKEWSDGGTRIHYKRLSFLGEFVHYQPPTPSEGNDGVLWKYRLKVGKELFLDLRYLLDLDHYLGNYDIEQRTIDDVEDIGDMRALKNFKANDESIYYDTEHVLVVTENIKYYYRWGALRYVFCKDSRHPTGYFQFYVRSNDGFAQYPYHKVDLFSRLLDYNTAPEALAEFEARIEGTYVEPWERPLTICLSAIGGAIVAGVGTWIVTYYVMCKKRGGGAVAAAADTPTDTSTDTPTDIPTDITSPES